MAAEGMPSAPTTCNCRSDTFDPAAYVAGRGGHGESREPRGPSPSLHCRGSETRSEAERCADLEHVLGRLQVEFRAAEVVVDLDVVDVQEAVAEVPGQARAGPQLETAARLPRQEGPVLVLEVVERVALRADVHP